VCINWNAFLDSRYCLFEAIVLLVVECLLICWTKSWMHFFEWFCLLQFSHESQPSANIKRFLLDVKDDTFAKLRRAVNLRCSLFYSYCGWWCMLVFRGVYGWTVIQMDGRPASISIGIRWDLYGLYSGPVWSLYGHRVVILWWCLVGCMDWMYGHTAGNIRIF